MQIKAVACYGYITINPLKPLMDLENKAINPNHHTYQVIVTAMVIKYVSHQSHVVIMPSESQHSDVLQDYGPKAPAAAAPAVPRSAHGFPVE